MPLAGRGPSSKSRPSAAGPPREPSLGPEPCDLLREHLAGSHSFPRLLTPGEAPASGLTTHALSQESHGDVGAALPPGSPSDTAVCGKPSPGPCFRRQPRSSPELRARALSHDSAPGSPVSSCSKKWGTEARGHTAPAVQSPPSPALEQSRSPGLGTTSGGWGQGGQVGQSLPGGSGGRFWTHGLNFQHLNRPPARLLVR